MKSSPEKIPKAIKLPWRNSKNIASGKDGSLIVLGGELGMIGKLNITAWQYEPWLPVKGFINDIAITDDGQLVAVSVADFENSIIEFRNVSGELIKKLPVPWNARIVWAPGGKSLFVKIETGINRPYEHCGVYDFESNHLKMLDIERSNSIVGNFIDDDNLILSIRNPDEPREKNYQLCFISLKKKETYKFSDFKFWDAYKKIVRLHNNTFAVIGYNSGWTIIDSTGKQLANSPDNRAAIASCLCSAGFITANGTDVNYYSPQGNHIKKFKAKKRVDAAAATQNYVFLYESATPQAIIEILPV